MLKMKSLILFSCITVFVMSGCSLIPYELKGRLLWPAYENNNKEVIYSLNLSKKDSEPKLFFQIGEKSTIFPSKYYNDIYYIATTNTSSNDDIFNEGSFYSEIIKSSKGKIESILKKKGLVLYPQAIDNGIVFYIGRMNQSEQYYIGMYDPKTKKDDVVIAGCDDDRPSISKDKEILYTKTTEKVYEKGNYTEITAQINIYLYDKEGNSKIIIEGMCPLWLEEGKIFLYESKDGISTFDLSKNESSIIFKNTAFGEIHFEDTPVLSPDKKYIAFYEEDGYPMTYRLVVMSLLDGSRIIIQPYSQMHSGNEGLEWIP